MQHERDTTYEIVNVGGPPAVLLPILNNVRKAARRDRRW